MSLASALLRRKTSPTERAIATILVMRSVARAFDVAPPLVSWRDPAEALSTFREFSAALCERFDGDRGVLEKRLFTRASRLGGFVRRVTRPDSREAAALFCWLYGALDIDASRVGDGDIIVTRCFFGSRYSCDTCATMSSFDSGFFYGLTGEGRLVFEERITQGSSCCRAKAAGVDASNEA